MCIHMYICTIIFYNVLCLFEKAPNGCKKDANLKMSVLLLLLHEPTQGTDPQFQ